MKRIAGVLKYHMLTIKWPMLLFMMIMIASYSATFIANTYDIVRNATGFMGSMRVENAVLTLGNQIETGFVPSCIFFLIISIAITSGRAQRTLVPLSITRKELMLGNTVYLLAECAILIAFMYAASTLARLALNIQFMAELGGMRPIWVLGGDGLTLFQRFMYTLAYMIGLAGPVLLAGCLMTRWKKQILFTLGVGFVLLILVSVRSNWLSFFADSQGVETLFNNVRRVFEWVRGYYVDGGLLLVALKQLLIYAVAMALSYPVMRWTRVIK